MREGGELVSHDPEPSVPLWLSYSLAVTAGVGMTTQAHVNGLLGTELGDGVVAAALSFAGGLLVLAGIAAFSRRVRTGLRSTRRSIDTGEISWVFTVAGLIGAGYVISQSAISPLVGLALFTVSFVCGLTIGGLLMDLWGVGPAGQRAITPLRLLGAILGIVAVVIAVSGSLEVQRESPMLAVPAIFGIGVAWQQAANGRLTRANRNPWSTTLINFGVGFAALMLGVLVIAITIGLPTNFPTNPWLYVGGPVGVVFIAIASIVVRYIGILIYGLCATTGQLVSAVVIDALDPIKGGITASIVIGAVVVAAGTALASLSGRWSGPKKR